MMTRDTRTVQRAALIVNARRHRLDGKRAARARQQPGVNRSEAHVRLLGRKHVLRRATRDAAGGIHDAVVAVCARTANQQ